MEGSRLRNEMEHARRVLSRGAGTVWGWETPAGRRRWARRVRMLTSHVRPGMEVLEAGCGTGYFTKELEKTGANIRAMDISADLLAVAKENVMGANVTFLIGNAYSLGFKDASFDTVIGSSVLHHLDAAKALREFMRVLKPGGTIRFTEPNMLNPQIALQKNVGFIKAMMGDSPDETAFFRWSLRRSLVECGFREVVVTPFDFLHPRTPARLVRFFETFSEMLEGVPILSEIAGSLYIEASKGP